MNLDVSSRRPNFPSTRVTCTPVLREHGYAQISAWRRPSISTPDMALFGLLINSPSVDTPAQNTNSVQGPLLSFKPPSLRFSTSVILSRRRSLLSLYSLYLNSSVPAATSHYDEINQSPRCTGAAGCSKCRRSTIIIISDCCTPHPITEANIN